jgi:hypothetical protein
LREDLGEVEGYWLSKDWKQHKKEDYKPFYVPKFDITSLKKDKVQIYYFIQHYPALYFYSQPDYSAALMYVELETEMQNFHLSSIKNGFNPSLQITFPNQPSEQERFIIEQDLTEHFGGSQGVNKPIVSFVDGIENKILVEPIQSTANADIYNTLNDLCTQKIISAHRLSSPTLAGLPGAGSLGGNGSEISTAYDYFYATVIRNKQLMIIDVFKELFSYNNFKIEDLAISNTKPLTYIPESLLVQYWSEDEIRNIYGFAPRETTNNNETNITPTEEI